MNQHFAGRALCAAIAALSTLTAHAADFTLSGEIGFHNKVKLAEIFIAGAPENVRIWTDSFQRGPWSLPATR